MQSLQLKFFFFRRISLPSSKASKASPPECQLKRYIPAVEFERFSLRLATLLHQETNEIITILMLKGSILLSDLSYIVPSIKAEFAECDKVVLVKV